MRTWGLALSSGPRALLRELLGSQTPTQEDHHGPPTAQAGKSMQIPEFPKRGFSRVLQVLQLIPLRSIKELFGFAFFPLFQIQNVLNLFA